DILRALVSWQRRLREPIDPFREQPRFAANAQPPAEGDAEELGLVVSALPQLLAVHRNRHNRIEGDALAASDHIFEQLCERMVEEIMVFEFEGVQQPLERAAVMAPRVAPFDRQWLFHASDARDGSRKSGVESRCISDSRLPI